ncbi:MAG: hypothetical protein E7166_01795 [Firmicutes bacterium]|nr:hypothetical protein [Bacillota bacterium]
MKKNIDKMNILMTKKVHLVQSGYFKPNIQDLKETDIKKINDIISLNYMGYGEFAFDALPSSLRRMTVNKDFYSVFVFNEYKDVKGNSLKIYAPEIFIGNIKNIIKQLTESGYGLKAYCSLSDYIKNTRSEMKDNFWWDIENDFFIFFEHTDKVITAMDSLRKNGYGNVKTISKKNLTKIYLQELTKQNKIIDYKYNKKSKIHQIDFSSDIPIETVLMDAITIARLDKKNVVFAVNGVSFYIDSHSLQDNIVENNGIKVIDFDVDNNIITGSINYYNSIINTRRPIQKILKK